MLLSCLTMMNIEWPSSKVKSTSNSGHLNKHNDHFAVGFNLLLLEFSPPRVGPVTTTS